jgi:hypothetical protein
VSISNPFGLPLASPTGKAARLESHALREVRGLISSSVPGEGGPGEGEEKAQKKYLQFFLRI